MKYIKQLIDFLEDEIGSMPAFKYEVLEITEETEHEEGYDVSIFIQNDFPSENDKKWHVSFNVDAGGVWIKLGEDYKNTSTNNSSIRYFWMALLLP